MTNKLAGILDAQLKQKTAMDVGTDVHARLKNVHCDENGTWHGDADIVAHISGIPELAELMGPMSKPEVPIAGKIDGRFVSRRLDRLYVNVDAKKVVVLDYKTDKNKQQYYKKYIEQLNEYSTLLKQIFRLFDVRCKILWLNDFTLENLD